MSRRGRAALSLLLMAPLLAGCVGSDPTRGDASNGGAPAADTAAHRVFPSSVGAAAFSFPRPANGTLYLEINGTVQFPFAVQATIVDPEGKLLPLFYGYELNVRHQEGYVGAGVNGETQQVSLGPFAFEFPAMLALNVTGHSGTLLLAWAGLPEGVVVRASEEGLGPALSGATGLPAEFVELPRGDQGAWAYGGGGLFASGQATRSQGTPDVPGPALVNLRLILPTNAGLGSLTLSAPSFEWSRGIGTDGPNTTCGDCHDIRRFLGVVTDPLTYDLAYAGVGANFQAYLMMSGLPPGMAVAAPNTLAEFPDCVTAFGGCD